MPARKRKITVSKRSAFWPCGSCRRNCTSGIQCDACTQWYHAQCEGLTDEELNSFSGTTAPYTCENCFAIELGSAPYEYLWGPTRMRQWSNSYGTDNLKIAARREAKRMPPFDLFGQSPISGDFVEQDVNAQYILNKCRLVNLGIPSMTTGDGNCLFNAVSIALTGNEDRAAELRLRTSVEMALNADTYQRRLDYDQLMTHSPSYNVSMKDCCTEGAYSSIWTMMALSSVVGLPIKSVYPPMNGTQCKAHTALSKLFVTDETEKRDILTVMWSRMGPWRPPNWTGNHFVPILKQERRRHTEAVTEQKHQEQRSQTPVEKKQHPRVTSDVKMKRDENLTPAPKKQDQFHEISTPISSFLIRDILGNDIQVTPIAKQAHESNDPPEAEINNDFMETSSVHSTDDTNQMDVNSAASLQDHSPINNMIADDTVDNDMVTDSTELKDSTEMETSQTIPVPDWKPQGARELIEKIYTVTELHFLDYRSALHDDGNYRLTKAESQYRVADALWRFKSGAERKELFVNFLKDSKKRKRKYIESNDGIYTVVTKAQTKATKACQSKRPRNERASSRR